MIMLNLAVIPDEVVREMHLQRGWQRHFKNLMQNYKDKFEGMCKWKYQDQELEDAYAKFVKEQEAKDEDHKQWIAEHKDR